MEFKSDSSPVFVDSEEVVDNLHRVLGCYQSLTKEFIREIIKDIQLFDLKNKRYGVGNIHRHGEFGILVRVDDKMERLHTMMTTKQESSEEPIKDTWQDISCYAVMARLVRAGLWPK